MYLLTSLNQFTDTAMVEPAYVVVVPGEARFWRVFREDGVVCGTGAVLVAFRKFILGLNPSQDGILKIGSVALCNHLAETARQSGLPTIFAAAPPPPDAVPVMAFDAVRRDHVRTLIRVRDLELDNRANVRAGRFSFLDRTSCGVRWLDWVPGYRLCLSGFRIKLISSLRAGLHLRVGVVEPNAPTRPDGTRIDPPRFISAAKPMSDGVHVIIPCDPVDPMRRLDSTGSTNDCYEDAKLDRAMLDFYGCSATQAINFRLGAGTEAQAAGYARRVA